MKSNLKGFCASLIDPKFAPTGLKVALVVGSILFVINHGNALLKGQIGRDRLISALLTYCVPYMVNIHGQYISQVRQKS
ncbi:nitrate/nitrite transporter NrtS [Oculatella sp. LEGE 06141]|uniref:nitrate/nitrite transporter NrtS n=1 Tax=Oculatella sp. LEGE 06141 TaxID=1828648 RepID=UPI001880E446|nr:nitrate/nitrite transporter NrtS [Oculatella sp. LEGE 06141]MBE9182737.1 nitrate/nitrite transporter NrtS [Oculatella sp. LEGE 06141]